MDGLRRAPSGDMDTVLGSWPDNDKAAHKLRDALLIHTASPSIHAPMSQKLAASHDTTGTACSQLVAKLARATEPHCSLPGYHSPLAGGDEGRERVRRDTEWNGARWKARHLIYLLVAALLVLRVLSWRELRHRSPSPSPSPCPFPPQSSSITFRQRVVLCKIPQTQWSAPERTRARPRQSPRLLFTCDRLKGTRAAG